MGIKSTGDKTKERHCKNKTGCKKNKQNTAATTYNTVSKYSNALGKQGNENTINTRVCDERGSKI